MSTCSARLVGVYEVSGHPCHLCELVVTGLTEPPDFLDITQRVASRDRKDWQAPYMEHLLNAEGDAIVADLFADMVNRWPQTARLAFFFHHLKLDKPLRTPWGDLAIPSPEQIPSRLAFFRYEAP